MCHYPQPAQSRIYVFLAHRHTSITNNDGKQKGNELSEHASWKKNREYKMGTVSVVDGIWLYLHEQRDVFVYVQCSWHPNEIKASKSGIKKGSDKTSSNIVLYYIMSEC